MNVKEFYPEIVYKYRDWSIETHKKVLLSNELFLASPGSFNDPFDCRIPENFHLINTPEKIEQFINKTAEKYESRIIDLGYDVKETNDLLRERFADLNTLQSEQEKFEISQVDKCYGVLSLSARWNSLLMWSHYGNEHKGFCIGFNEQKLRESKLFGKGGLVNYTDSFPERNPLIDLDPMIDGDKQLNHKASDWAYEQEYRLFKLNPDGLTINERIVAVPDSCIAEINLGINISENDRDEIVEIAAKRGIQIYQLEKTPFKFDLTRTKI